MGIDTWQDVVVLALIATALVYMAQRITTLGKRQTACGSTVCAKCDRRGCAEPTKQADPVQIQKAQTVEPPR